MVTARLGGGFSRINFVSVQLLAHGVAEYLCENHDRNELANAGVAIGFDSRFDSQGFAQTMAAVFKAYGVRVFLIDRPAVTPFFSYFCYKFKCLLGLLVTGRDLPKTHSGVSVFDGKGRLVSQEISASLDKSIVEYSNRLYYLVDLSPLFDYSAKKVRFKPDNFTDVTMK